MKKNHEFLRKEIGYFIKKARMDMPMTGSQLGALVCVSQQQISRYERGASSLNIETLNVFLEVLGKDWMDFYNAVLKVQVNGLYDEKEINNIFHLKEY